MNHHHHHHHHCGNYKRPSHKMNETIKDKQSYRVPYVICLKVTNTLYYYYYIYINKLHEHTSTTHAVDVLRLNPYNTIFFFYKYFDKNLVMIFFILRCQWSQRNSLRFQFLSVQWTAPIQFKRYSSDYTRFGSYRFMDCHLRLLWHGYYYTAATVSIASGTQHLYNQCHQHHHINWIQFTSIIAQDTIMFMFTVFHFWRTSKNLNCNEQLQFTMEYYMGEFRNRH